jgi:hypothetical protein
MWSWAKASKSIESVHADWDHSTEATQNELRNCSFLRQLRKDAEFFASPQNPVLHSLKTLSKLDGDEVIGDEYENGLLEFLLARYNETIRLYVAEGLNSLMLAREEEYV